MSAGVVDQNVDAAECPKRGIDEFADRRLVGDVGGNADHAAAGFRQLAYRRVQSLGVATANCDTAALLQKRIRDGLADPARRTGDDSGFPAQTQLHPPLAFLLH